ncbi:hypothetical protein Vi05172_g3205 [Venturia inaequalis]|nr:hypothetical protein Vi05172_g3205 [Venturia inaequalis]
MANGWSLIIGFVIIALFSVGSWFLSPKGENQTYVPRPLPQSQSYLYHRTRVASQILFLALRVQRVAHANVTNRVWRSSLILSAWSCFLMWAITFLAQWHPLITPINNSLRPEYVH